MPRLRPVSPGRLRISGGQDGTCGRSGGYSRIFGATRPGSSSTVRSSRRRQYLSLWPWAPRTARYSGSRLGRGGRVGGAGGRGARGRGGRGGWGGGLGGRKEKRRVRGGGGGGLCWFC